jgi:hypothetical protein
MCLQANFTIVIFLLATELSAGYQITIKRKSRVSNYHNRRSHGAAILVVRSRLQINRLQRIDAVARAAFAAAVEEKPAGRFMIRHRIRVVKRHPEGDW